MNIYLHYNTAINKLQHRFRIFPGFLLQSAAIAARIRATDTKEVSPMRKILCCLLVLVLLLGAAPGVFAAGSASLGGPNTVRAGDTITLVFYAGGGILGGSGNMSYDSSQLTLQGYTAAIGGSWRVEFTGNRFLFYDDSMLSPINGSAAIFKATFTVNKNLQPGTEIAVSASGVTLSDGERDFGAGSPTYRKTIAPPLSDNCNLASMTVTNAKISPAFSPAVTSYTTSVPFTTKALQIQAEAEHEGAKVTIGNTALTPGGTTKVSVTVTAENGTTKTYTIRATRAQDPNYVPSGNADLSALSIEGLPLSPGFDAAVHQYYLWLPYEMEAVKLTAELADKKAKLKIDPQPELIPGKAADMAVTVTAENGTQKVYTLTLFRAPAHENMEDFLSGKVELPPPETEPETIPETQPAPQELPESDWQPIWLCLLVGVCSCFVSVGITVLIFLLIQRKKNKEIYNL